MYRVLIADDEPWSAYGLAHIIDWSVYGFLVCDTALNGQEALEKCLKQRPDLLISDIRMPGMDGLALMEAVKRLLPDMLVVFVSGYSQFSYAQRAVQLGALDYLLKQVTKEQLIALLQRTAVLLGERDSRMHKERDSAVAAQGEGVLAEPWLGLAGNAPEQVLRYVNENFCRDMRITEVAARFHFSPNYFSTFFRKHTGQNFTHYIMQKRIALAKQLLQETTLSIQEVVDRTGYGDYFQFNKLFKRETGIAPGKYRDKIKNKE